MKAIIKYALMGAMVMGIMTSCDDQFDPEGLPAGTPADQVARVTALESTYTGRKVTLTWTLPQSDDIEAVYVMSNADWNARVTLPADATTYTFKGQPTEKENVYTVKVAYKNGQVSEGVSTLVTLPAIKTKAGFLLLADTPAQLPDDDERAAAEWFAQQPDTQFITPAELATLDPDFVSVLWIEIDRVGIGAGWERLPSEVTDAGVIEALKEYSANGGSIYLSNMATELTVPLGMVPDNMAPTVFGDGNGGHGDDYWVAMTCLGWIFRPGGPNDGEQGYYDRTAHAIYKDIVFEDLNGWGFVGLPLIGPGDREDHNCMWDCNIYGKGSEKDVIANFEKLTNSMVLATWGHVQDHCVAGIVDFFATSQHGRCVAVGLAAYEWNQNDHVNVYQHNIEQLTSNILNYLK